MRDGTSPAVLPTTVRRQAGRSALTGPGSSSRAAHPLPRTTLLRTRRECCKNWTVGVDRVGETAQTSPTCLRTRTQVLSVLRPVPLATVPGSCRTVMLVATGLILAQRRFLRTCCMPPAYSLPSDLVLLLSCRSLLIVRPLSGVRTSLEVTLMRKNTTLYMFNTTSLYMFNTTSLHAPSCPVIKPPLICLLRPAEPLRRVPARRDRLGVDSVSRSSTPRSVVKVGVFVAPVQRPKVNQD